MLHSALAVAEVFAAETAGAAIGARDIRHVTNDVTVAAIEARAFGGVVALPIEREGSHGVIDEVAVQAGEQRDGQDKSLGAAAADPKTEALMIVRGAHTHHFRFSPRNSYYVHGLRIGKPPRMRVSSSMVGHCCLNRQGVVKTLLLWRQLLAQR